MNDPIQPLNPLDGLASTTIPPARAKTGRRELRTALLSRGLTIHARPRTLDDKLRAGITGEMIGTLPITRKEPKRGGMGKKEWKRARRALREAASKKENTTNV